MFAQSATAPSSTVWSAVDTRLHPLEAVRAVRRLFKNPDDTRQVFTIIRAMRGRSGVKSFQRFAKSPTGAAILRQRPSLLAALQNRRDLAQLPDGSVGRAYLDFVETEKLSADGLVDASQNFANDPVPPEMSFYRDRMRDAHDLTHVLTGYGRDSLGEYCLLAFMYAHNGNLGVALIVAMGWLRQNKVGRMAAVEAWRNGHTARWLQDQDFEALLSRPLDEVRRELNIATPTRYRTEPSA